MVASDRWKRRDQVVIDGYFGAVDGFTQYTDHMLMMEAPHGRLEALVDYRWTNSSPSVLGRPIEVIWSVDGHAMGKFGESSYLGEAEVLSELYLRLAIPDGRVPAPVQLPYDVDRYMWLSDRHRAYDPRMYCMDVDAFSLAGDGLAVIWDFKHEHGKWTGFEDSVLSSVKSPVFKVEYAFVKTDWVQTCSEDYVTLRPANPAARRLARAEGNDGYGRKLELEQALDKMNRLVSHRRNG